MIRCINLLAVVALPLLCQSQIRDDFSDGDFHSNPPWTGDTSNFTIDTNFHLRSNGNPLTETIVLGTNSNKIRNTIWEFWINCEFPTSSGNHPKVYLVADTNLPAPNGYYLKFGGEPGNLDGIDLILEFNGNTQKIIEGQDGLFGKERNFARVLVERDFFGNWKLKVDTFPNGGTFLAQGEGFDSTITNSDFFLISFDHTSTRKDLLTFDDLLIKNGPMKIISARQKQFDKILLSFSSPLSSANPPNLLNFSLDSFPNHPLLLNPIGVEGNQVELIFGNTPDQGLHRLWVRDIYDDEGNHLVLDSIEFFIYDKDPDFRDLTINEVFFDPIPQIGLPLEEFFEIYNGSESIFHLADFKISFGNKETELPSETIFPGEHIIICKTDIADEYAYWGKTIGLEDFPTLLNSGGTLTLKTQSGFLVDKLSYSSSMFSKSHKREGGFSLEQIDPDKECSGSGNWDGSIAPEGGSPGLPNSILNHSSENTPNRLIGFHVIGGSFVELHFEKGINSTGLSTESIQIDQGISILEIGIADSSYLDKLILSTFPALHPGQIYTLSSDSLLDCDGMSFKIFPTPFGRGKKPSFGELIITEYLPIQGSEEGFKTEFFELFNNSDSLIEFEGTVLSDWKSSTQLPARILFPGERILLAESEDPLFPDEVSLMTGLTLPNINNAGDTIWLRSRDGETLQQIVFDPLFFQFEDIHGKSLELIHPQASCSRQNQWKISNENGTPGRINSRYDASFSLPPLRPVFATLVDSVLNISLNQYIDSSRTSTGGNLLYGPSDKSLDFEIFDQHLIKAEVGSLEGQIKVESFGTCFEERSGIVLSEVSMPVEPIPATLVINEIMFNPVPTGVDFLEVLNIGFSDILISELEISGWDQEEEIIRIKPEIPFLVPGQFLVLTEDTISLKNRFPFSPPGSFIQVPELPRMPDDEGNISIKYRTLNIDSLSYDEDWHFPLIEDPEGVSLERIYPRGKSNDADNWSSASYSSGFGTPGLPNSQLYYQGSSQEYVIIEPEIFSPNQDGYQDRVAISINGNKIPASVSITIFDHQGRLIKTLISNQNLGSENTFFWDGLNEENTVAGFGNYIVLITLIDRGGKIQKVKKIVGLGGYLK